MCPVNSLELVISLVDGWRWESPVRVGTGRLFQEFHGVGEGVDVGDDVLNLPLGCLADLNFGRYNQGLRPRR